MNNSKKTLFGLSIFVALLHAESNITVHNRTKLPVYAAVYCKPVIGSSSERKTNVIKIAPNASTKLKRPDVSVKCHRTLAFSFLEKPLEKKISNKNLEQIAHKNIGLSKSFNRVFDTFYIDTSKDKLKAYNPIQWETHKAKAKIGTTWASLTDEYRSSFLEKHPMVKNNLHQGEVAQVRIGNNIPEAEQAYLAKRKVKVKQQLEKLLSKKLNGNFVPNIAFVNSGGGARALLTSLGFHIGAQKTGLLDAVTYDTGLSGGSWFLATWLMSRATPQQFKDLIKPIMAQGMDPKKLTSNEIKLITNALLLRSALNQPITLVTVWGALLANHYFAWFKENRQHVLFSHLGDPRIDDRLHKGEIPFPILTAANGYDLDKEKYREKMNWFTFTPYEAGGVGDWLGNRHIPIWAVGRKFVSTQSINKAPEYDLGYIMGITGSAFAPTYARAYEESVGSIPVLGSATQFLMKQLFTDSAQYTFENKRISVGKIPNFAKDATNSQMAGKQNIRLVDCAMAFNIPMPPILQSANNMKIPRERKSDIIIICDATGSIESGINEALDYTIRYAKEQNIKLPAINLKDVHKKALSIFKDPNDVNAPIVIYMPRVIDRNTIKYPEWIPQNFNVIFATTKFQYSANQVDNLTGVMEANFIQSWPKIKQEIEWLIQKRNGFAR